MAEDPYEAPRAGRSRQDLSGGQRQRLGTLFLVVTALALAVWCGMSVQPDFADYQLLARLAPPSCIVATAFSLLAMRQIRSERVVYKSSGVAGLTSMTFLVISATPWFLHGMSDGIYNGLDRIIEMVAITLVGALAGAVCGGLVGLLIGPLMKRGTPA